MLGGRLLCQQHLHGSGRKLRRPWRWYLQQRRLRSLRRPWPALLWLESEHGRVHRLADPMQRWNLRDLRGSRHNLLRGLDGRRRLQQPDLDVQRQQPLHRLRGSWAAMLSGQPMRKPRLLLQQ